MGTGKWVSRCIAPSGAVTDIRRRSGEAAFRRIECQRYFGRKYEENEILHLSGLRKCDHRQLQAIDPKKAEGEEKLSDEVIENDYYISSEHEMVRDHYISFVALLTSDTMMLRKQYPEWGLQVRIPVFAHGRLLWYCSKHGLFYQEI